MNVVARSCRYGVRQSGVVLAIVCVLAGAAGEASGQAVELHGRVVDAESGRPLVDAVVRLPAVRKYTLTDEAGEFVLTDVPRGVQTLVVVQLGYGEQAVRVDVQAGAFHVVEVAPQPIPLDPLLAADQRQVHSLLNSAAQSRALTMSGRAFQGPPVFWRSWDGDAIAASGIAEPLRFLSRGPPRVGILTCASLGLPADRLCVSVPYAGTDPHGYGNNPVRFTTRLDRRLGGGIYRGPSRPPPPPTSRIAAVYLDDRPLGALENLEQYDMADIERVETYGYKGERGIRLYTAGHMRLIALGVVEPDTRVPPSEIYEFRRRRARFEPPDGFRLYSRRVTG
jgi:hypothetical protein